MAALQGKVAHVVLQMGDGRAFSGQVMVGEVRVEDSEVSVPMIGGSDWTGMFRLPQWDMELRGIGPLVFSEVGEMEAQLEGVRSGSEWMCPWCGSVNLREHRKCEGCNARRPFVWD